MLKTITGDRPRIADVLAGEVIAKMEDVILANILTEKRMDGKVHKSTKDTVQTEKTKENAMAW